MATRHSLFFVAEAASVVVVDDDAAGEDHDAVIFGDGDGQFVPVKEVGADGVAPTHVSPLVAEGVVLEEEMVFVLEEDESVGVVGPMFGGREVDLRAVGLVVCWNLRGKGQSVERNCGYTNDRCANERVGHRISPLGAA